MRHSQNRRLQCIVLSSCLALLIAVGSFQFTLPPLSAPAIPIAGGPGNQNGGGG